MRRSVLVGLSLGLGLLGCGNSGVVTGTVAGNTLTVRDAIYATATDGQDTVALIELSSMSGVCELAKAGKVSKNEIGLQITLAQVDSQGHLQAPSAGTYLVGDDITTSTAQQAGALFLKNDSSCQDTIDLSTGDAVAGKVVITRVDANGAEGTFDITVGNQADHLTGSFNAATCAISSTTSQTPICQ